jgi:uncharacterized protein YjbI with pentapeptide repeats
MTKEELIEAYKQGRRDFRGVDLSRADLRTERRDFRGVDMTGVDLRTGRRDFTGVDLSDADLRGADLRLARLSYANLHGANLSDANLSGVEWTDMRLSYEFRSDSDPRLSMRQEKEAPRSLVQVIGDALLKWWNAY